MKGIMKFKKLAAFVLLAAVLVGMVPEREAKAAEYMTLSEALEYFGFTYGSSLDSNYYIQNYEADHPYYAIYIHNNGYYITCYTDLHPYKQFKTKNTGFWFMSSYLEDMKTNFTNGNSKELYGYHTGYFKAKGPSIEIIYANFDVENWDYVTLNETGLEVIINLSSHVHIWTSKEQPATCTTPGRSWEECACGEIQNETEVPALGHSWEPKEEPGSCTADSRTWEECSLCSAVQNEVVTPSDGHVWLDKEEPATCTTSGRSWQECACGEVQNDTVLPAFGHSWEQKEQTGNCAVASKTWEECSLCSAIQNEVVTPASGHVYDDDDDNVCNVCYYNRNIERLGDFLDMLPKILTLFCIFPLNIYLIINLVVLGVILYRSLKKK